MGQRPRLHGVSAALFISVNDIRRLALPRKREIFNLPEGEQLVRAVKNIMGGLTFETYCENTCSQHSRKGNYAYLSFTGQQ